MRLRRLLHLVHGADPAVRKKLLAIDGLLIVINLAAWTWALIAFHAHPALLGTALVAYGFGLRHAVDADHIAAIDNVTRKMIREGRRPVAVGLFFSLGHSSVVVLAAIAVAFATTAIQGRFDHFKEIGGVVSTVVSSFFLFALALMNLVILRGIHRAWRRVRDGGAYVDDDFDLLLAGRGFIARILRPLFRLVTRSWHMYPLGVLFGLGFDTATEVALLGIAATQAAEGLSPWAILVFPALFSAAMSLVDTLDGQLMLGAYGWAYERPLRKIYYNMTITLVSILVALVIGGTEALGLAAGKFGLTGPVWNAIASLYGNFDKLGYVIIGIFAVSWLASIAIYRAMDLDGADDERQRLHRLS